MSENLIGKKFNKLKVIRKAIEGIDYSKRKYSKNYWVCMCDCGNIRIVDSYSLKTGHTKSCGCLQKEIVSKISSNDLVGKRFGKLIVTRKSNRKDKSGSYYWYCDCDCGTKDLEISGHNLVCRGTQSCGCIKSKGEEKISSILKEHNIDFKKEFYFEDLKSDKNKFLRFDFAIFKNKKLVYLIEYQGEQHFKSRKTGYFTDKKVKSIKKRDKLKKDYCKKKEIPLIYISYKKYKKINSNDIIIKELLQEE